ncbi:MAG: FkbM family methyltransferase [Proteobacteria bacterium]|nr:FkbM family methyltransferase [Pseudomonadota bacterium]
MPDYEEVIDMQGVRIPYIPSVITPRIERSIRNNRYERGERDQLVSMMGPDDRVLELGAGVGLISTVAARICGAGRVTSIEANPDLLPVIREVHRLNGVGEVDLRNGAATATAGEPVQFYLRSDFWASSMEPESRPYARTVTVPRLGIGALLAEVQPTIIVCDIEGGELGLFDDADLSGVNHVIIELHPKVYGESGVDRVAGALAAKGLFPSPDSPATSTVRIYERNDPRAATASAALSPAVVGRGFRAWPIADPRILVATCMKDEGPFILEWLAWHKAAGVTDFVVFTNDCSDGTDLLLDRLDQMGELTHLPNPAVVTGQTAFQPIALAYAERMPVMRRADFFISMDVDEFINVKTGEGRIADLFATAGEFDVLSMTELNHGANGREHFAPGWIKDQFPLHETLTPGKYRARRGVKSIVRLSDRVVKLRNHRPDIDNATIPPIWIDGSGRPIASLAADGSENGLDCRRTYDLVTLDHFALRSLDSYLAKMHRGDVVKAGRSVSQKYWRLRNRNDESGSIFDRLDGAARAYHAARYEADPVLMALHGASCAAHEARIAAIVDLPEFRARRDWALREAW